MQDMLSCFAVLARYHHYHHEYPGNTSRFLLTHLPTNRLLCPDPFVAAADSDSATMQPESEKPKKAPRKHVTTACVPCRESKVRVCCAFLPFLYLFVP